MTDRELLEAAAKAAGVEIGRYDADPIGVCAGFNIPDTNTWWNPLIDDGDALRLLTTMHSDTHRVELLIEPKSICVFVRDRAFVREKILGGVLNSTRRAIVRAAAEIGSET